MNDQPFTGERTLWWAPADHLQEFAAITNWYFLAMSHAKDKHVLDLGAGHAFGSFLLSTVASELDTYDNILPIEPNHVGLPFVCPTTHHVLDLEKREVDERGDLAVAIEVIEHLENPDFMLENLKVPALFFTVPCYGNKNEFHKIEYSEESAKALVERHFPHLTYRMERRRMLGYATRDLPF